MGEFKGTVVRYLTCGACYGTGRIPDSERYEGCPDECGLCGGDGAVYAVLPPEMAAAKELLAACEKVAMYLHGTAGNLSVAQHEDAMRVLRSAIAKALGPTNDDAEADR